MAPRFFHTRITICVPAYTETIEEAERLARAFVSTPIEPENVYTTIHVPYGRLHEVVPVGPTVNGRTVQAIKADEKEARIRKRTQEILDGLKNIDPIEWARKQAEEDIANEDAI